MAERTLQDLAFPRLTDEQIAIIAKSARLKCCNEGDTLFDLGETGMKFYVVKSGEVDILDHSNGQPRTVTIHRPGQFTGDISHLTGNALIVSGVCRGGDQSALAIDGARP